MNFPDQNTTGNKSSRSKVSPSRNRELEVAQARLLRSYEQDQLKNEQTDSPSLRSLTQALTQMFIDLTRM